MIVSNCFKCEIAHGRTNIVNPINNKNAPVIFISSKPSYKDDKTAIMYSNNAGQLFLKILKLLGIYKHSYFIYLVRCKTGLREPTKKEINNCIPYAIKELNNNNYKIIVLVGSLVLNSYWDNKELADSNKKKKVVVYNDKLIIYISSPNYIFDPITKSKVINFINDLLLIKKIINIWKIKP